MRNLHLIFFILSIFLKANVKDSVSMQPGRAYYFSFLPQRFAIGEAVIFFEHTNKKNRGTELGIGRIFPSSIAYFFSSYKTGNYNLYGYSIWAARKFYNVDTAHIFFYLAPEITLRYEYNNNGSERINDNGMYTYFSQQRISGTLSGKIGWRNKSGILDFYAGAGIKLRYALTEYNNPPNRNVPSRDYKLFYDNGFYFFPVFRMGLKIGLCIKKEKT